MEIEAEILVSRKMGGRGRLQIPITIRKKLGLEEGVVVLFLQDTNGRIFIQKAPKLKKDQLGTY